jgi:hypothetical protein
LTDRWQCIQASEYSKNASDGNLGDNDEAENYQSQTSDPGETLDDVDIELDGR